MLRVVAVSTIKFIYIHMSFYQFEGVLPMKIGFTELLLVFVVALLVLGPDKLHKVLSGRCDHGAKQPGEDRLREVHSLRQVR